MYVLKQLTSISTPSFIGIVHSLELSQDPKCMHVNLLKNERKSEQAHIPHDPTLLEKAVYNEWQFQALGTGNRTKKGI